MKQIGQGTWKLGKRSKLDIKIQNFEKFQNLSEDFEKASLKTHSLVKKNEANRSRNMEVWEKVKI